MVRHTTYVIKDGIKYAVTRSFHLACGAFSLFLIWGLALNLSEGVSLLSMLHIVLLLLLTVIGTLYRDTWVFDKQTNTATSYFGIGPFCKIEKLAFSEIQRLEITHFVRGTNDKDAKPTRRRFRAMLVFSLKLNMDDKRDIEIIAEKTSGGRTESAVQAIAAVTELPLFVDRPRDMDLNVSYKDL